MIELEELQLIFRVKDFFRNMQCIKTYAFSQERILDTNSTKHLPKVKAVPLSICDFPRTLTKQQ